LLSFLDFMVYLHFIFYVVKAFVIREQPATERFE